MTEAHAFCEATGELYCDAELVRVKGAIIRRQSLAASPRPRSGQKGRGDSKRKARAHLPAAAREAEACFRRALEIARRQEARAWELRAAMSLADLWAQQGKVDDARRLLGDVYGWFTEGFKTRDLVAAKRQLADLA